VEQRIDCWAEYSFLFAAFTERVPESARRSGTLGNVSDHLPVPTRESVKS
jgi:hypothetical protein